MALQVLGSKTQDGKTLIVIESDKSKEWSLAITELQGPDSRRMAIQHATAHCGVSNARTELPSAPYAVDEHGNDVTRPTEQKIHRYRVDVPITQGM